MAFPLLLFLATSLKLELVGSHLEVLGTGAWGLQGFGVRVLQGPLYSYQH